MSTQPTPTGWIETVVTEHKIKVAKPLMKVEYWNNFNVANPNQRFNEFVCNRCQTFWSSIPAEQQVILCIMEKGVNQCICEECAKEIDQSLIIK
jgi:hypothetical protein